MLHWHRAPAELAGCPVTGHAAPEQLAPKERPRLTRHVQGLQAGELVAAAPLAGQAARECVASQQQRLQLGQPLGGAPAGRQCPLQPSAQRESRLAAHTPAALRDWAGQQRPFQAGGCSPVVLPGRMAYCARCGVPGRCPASVHNCMSSAGRWTARCPPMPAACRRLVGTLSCLQVQLAGPMQLAAMHLMLRSNQITGIPDLPSNTPPPPPPPNVPQSGRHCTAAAHPPVQAQVKVGQLLEAVRCPGGQGASQLHARHSSQSRPGTCALRQGVLRCARLLSAEAGLCVKELVQGRTMHLTPKHLKQGRT